MAASDSASAPMWALRTGFEILPPARRIAAPSSPSPSPHRTTRCGGMHQLSTTTSPAGFSTSSTASPTMPLSSLGQRDFDDVQLEKSGALTEDRAAHRGASSSRPSSPGSLRHSAKSSSDALIRGAPPSRNVTMVLLVLMSNRPCTRAAHSGASCSISPAGHRASLSSWDVMLKACLNGARRPAEHPRLPVTAAAIAAEAVRAVQAGAEALHVHPKNSRGADTLDPPVVAAVLEAVRGAVPGMQVGVTTGAWAMPDPRRRVTMIRDWTVLPDFASVNWHEPGAQEVAEALFEHGVGVEAGLWQPATVTSWRNWDDHGRCIRVLLEVVEDVSAHQAVAAAAQLVSALDGDLSTPILLHGTGRSSWPLLGEAIRRGFDQRIGLEDVLVLPDGSPADGKAELVAAARALLDGA